MLRYNEISRVLDFSPKSLDIAALWVAMLNFSDEKLKIFIVAEKPLSHEE